MKNCVGFALLALGFVFFSCKEPSTPYEDEATLASAELNQTVEDINNSEVLIQLAQMPKPEGTPILVGIDKSFWVEDPTDPTPFINVVRIFSQIYLINDNVYGEWYYMDTTWTRRGVSDTNLVRLVWVNNLSDTNRLTLYVDSTDGMTSYIHVLKGRLIVDKSRSVIFSSTFLVNSNSINVHYQIKGVANFYVNAQSTTNDFSMFTGTISGGVVKVDDSARDTVVVNATCKADSTRDVQVIFKRQNIVFRIDASVSKVQLPQSGPKYRDITGNFISNSMDIGDLFGRKYEYQDDVHQDYLKIILKSGKTLNIW